MTWLGPLLGISPTSLRACVEAFQVAIGILLASDDPRARWVGARLRDWLTRGGDLQAELGLRPVRGSRITPQVIACYRHPHEDDEGTMPADSLSAEP